MSSNPTETLDINVNLHFDRLQVSITPPRLPGQPVTAFLTIGGNLMPASLSVDDTTGKVLLTWVDDKGDTDAAAPPNARIQFGCDNPAVATVDADSGAILPTAEGSANATVEITDSTTGGPLLEPDGVTPFAPASVSFSVVPGAAVGVALSVQA